MDTDVGDMIATITMSKVFFQKEMAISLKDLAFARNHASMTARLDADARRLVLSFATELLSGRVDNVVSFEKVPRDWWQAFRERWLPKWWIRRHPILYRHITTESYIRVCPHLDIKSPPGSRNVDLVHLNYLEGIDH